MGAASAEPWKEGMLQGLEPVSEAISWLPGPEETSWGSSGGGEGDPLDPPTELRKG